MQHTLVKKVIAGFVLVLLFSGLFALAARQNPPREAGTNGTVHVSNPDSTNNPANHPANPGATFVALAPVPPDGERTGEVLPPPPPVRLSVQGAEKAIELRELSIQAEISGSFAWTTVDMQFYNPNARVLEGELQFPLADGQVITGFALSMPNEKGKEVMREAVPVPKNQGRQVFEEVIRQRIDPALLEVTQGNHFKLRVYPLDPGKTRRVRLRYRERLPQDQGRARYRLPLAYATQPAHLSLSLRARGSKAPVLLGGPPGLSLAFAQTKEGWLARLPAKEIALTSNAVILLRVPVDKTTFQYGNFAGKTYFYAELPDPETLVRPRALPQRVSLFWDASLSGEKRDHAKEFAFLEAFFAQARNVTVRVRKIRNVSEAPQSFAVTNGDWSALKKDLAATIYDGATNLAALDFADDAELNLLFSDGLDNYSPAQLAPPSQPLYAVISTPGADTARLKRLAAQGALIDLGILDAQGGVARLNHTRPHIVAVEGDGIADAVWSAAAPDTFLVAGLVRDAARPVRIVFSDGAKRLVQQFPAGLPASPDGVFSDVPGVPFLWAALTLENLEAEHELNRGAIRRLGKQFGLPTRETSLIVLDRVEDYVAHEIEPPEELKAAYDRLRAHAPQAARDRRTKMEQVKAEWEQRDAWWKKDFPKDKPRKTRTSNKETARGYFGNRASAILRERRESRDGSEFKVSEFKESAAAEPMFAAEDKASGSAQNSTLSIAVRPWSSDAPYIARMKGLGKAYQMYRVYLDERPDYANSAAFYLDVADQFFARGETELAQRVLSNLAEIDLENRQILRILGYRLLATGEARAAVRVFRRVLHLAEDEPQSWRDLGLALAAAGEEQAAIEHLYAVVERVFARDFPGIEVIALTEMNAIIAEATAKGRPLDTRGIDPLFLRNRPLDLRVVLTWDSDNTDIDLHVIDPNQEETFYSAPLSYQGGRVSPDNTQGYGPEEYTLKRAKPGTYRVEVQFYGHQQQILSEATTLQLDFFTRYASEHPHKQSVTLRLKDAKERILVGEFEVKPDTP
ncbi:MAG: DUF2135 domain-containing protein [Zoogloeaceae bacterium]|jgi:tetratricopeptide (TPR) repeat protein|nr:DUF2135 domain-containing protein [Zoogloeaceae bacterium]